MLWGCSFYPSVASDVTFGVSISPMTPYPPPFWGLLGPMGVAGINVG